MKSFLTKLFGSKARRAARNAKSNFRPQIDNLEERQLLSTVTLTLPPISENAQAVAVFTPSIGDLLLTNPSHGTVSQDGAYTPDRGFVGSDSFTHGSILAPLIGDVTIVNITVQADHQQVLTTVNTPVLAFVPISAPNGIPLTSVTSLPSNGVVNPITGLYFPNQGFVGTDSLTIVSPGETLVVDITVADLQVVTTNENTPVFAFIPIPGPNGVPSTFVTSFPSNGTIDAFSGLYIPNPGFVGTDSLTIITPSLGRTVVVDIAVQAVAAPAITSANSTTFTVGTQGVFYVIAGGLPVTESGALPNGVTYDRSQYALVGTPAAGTAGTYSIRFTASNSGVTTDQPFTLTVVDAVPAPSFTSATNTTFTVGTQGVFYVVAGSLPVKENGALPNGVIYDPVQRALVGAPALGTAGIYRITFGASNAGGSTLQPFTLTVVDSTSPSFSATGNPAFTVGVRGTFSLVVSGAPKPTVTESGTLPSGVSFDASQNALVGTPAAGTAGTYLITFTASNSAGTFGQSFNLTVVGASSSPTPNQIYVTDVFKAVLNRTPTQVELDYWSNQVGTSAGRGIFANTLTHSAEYYGTIASAAYQKYLGRTPDASGLAYWVSRMQAGLTDERLEAGFIGSPEYYQHTGGTDKLWVDNMYLNLLGRAPDAAGESYWVGVLANGGNRANVAYGFAGGLEREQQHVTANYLKYLGRLPDGGGLNYWVGQFVSGAQTNEDLVAGFVGSDEYFATHSRK